MELKYLLQDLTYRTHTQNILVRLVKKIPPLNSFLLNMMWSDYDFKNYYSIYLKMRGLLSKNGVKLHGKRMLEIGSGNLPALGFPFILQDKVAFFRASDPYRTGAFRSKKNTKRLRTLTFDCAEMGMRGADKLVNFFGGTFSLNTDVIDFSSVDITEECSDDHKYDLIVSNAVLEHVAKEKMDQSILNMNLLLNLGGLMVHQIDFRDHMNFNRPFGNAGYSDEEWDDLTCGTIFYTNRLKSEDFIRLFRRNGFEIVDIEETSVKRGGRCEGEQVGVRGAIFLVKKLREGMTSATA